MRRARITNARGSPRRAITRIELLPSVACLALLALLLGSGFEKEVRDRKAMAQCLKNLRVIGAALQMYSAEDSIDQVIPIHQSTVTTRPPHYNYTFFFFIRPWAWGGTSGTSVIPFSANGTGIVLNETDSVGSFYAAGTRPLRHYLAADPFSSEPESALIFECPSDAGYPSDPRIDAMLPTARGRPLFPMLGNSYRRSVYAARVDSGYRQFSLGAYGHRLSGLTGLDRQVLLGDPLFFSMLGIGQTDPNPLVGWHGQAGADNVLFADGAARLTDGSEPLDHESFPDEPSTAGLDPSNRAYLWRTSTFKIDTYPTPGAAINFRPGVSPTTLILANPNQWPLLNYENNLPAQ